MSRVWFDEDISEMALTYSLTCLLSQSYSQKSHIVEVNLLQQSYQRIFHKYTRIAGLVLTNNVCPYPDMGNWRSSEDTLPCCTPCPLHSVCTDWLTDWLTIS